MRYFNISFIWKEENSVNYGYGTYYLESETFPSWENIISNIKSNKKYKTDTVVIFNIFEFKNEEDYKEFIKKP